jgi:hypothetical protein
MPPAFAAPTLEQAKKKVGISDRDDIAFPT